MKILRLIGVAMIIAIMIAIVNTDRCHNSMYCSEKEQFILDNYSGVVLKKFKNFENHNFRTISIKGKEDMILTIDTSQLYSYINAGDSIIKGKNTDYISVDRNGIRKKFVLYFNCSK